MCSAARAFQVDRIKDDRGLGRPVWVELRKLVRATGPEREGPPIEDELDLERQAPGLLHWWVRAGRGEWMGVVSFEVRVLNGDSEIYLAARQLVPAYALRRRTHP